MGYRHFQTDRPLVTSRCSPASCGLRGERSPDHHGHFDWHDLQLERLKGTFGISCRADRALASSEHRDGTRRQRGDPPAVPRNLAEAEQTPGCLWPHSKGINRHSTSNGLHAKDWMLDVRCWMFDVGCSMWDVRCGMFEVSGNQVGREWQRALSIIDPPFSILYLFLCYLVPLFDPFCALGYERRGVSLHKPEIARSS